MIQFFQRELDQMPQHKITPGCLGYHAYQQEIANLYEAHSVLMHALIACNIGNIKQNVLFIYERDQNTPYLGSKRTPLPASLASFIDNIHMNEACLTLWEYYFKVYNHKELSIYFNQRVGELAQSRQRTQIILNIVAFAKQLRARPEGKLLFGVHIMLDIAKLSLSPARPQHKQAISEEKSAEEEPVSRHLLLTNNISTTRQGAPADLLLTSKKPFNKFTVHLHEMAELLNNVIHQSHGEPDDYDCALIIFTDCLLARIQKYKSNDSKLRLLYTAEKQLLDPLLNQPTSKLLALQNYLHRLQLRLQHTVPDEVSADFNELQNQYSHHSATPLHHNKLAFITAVLQEAQSHPEVRYDTCIASVMKNWPDHGDWFKGNKGLWGHGFFSKHRTFNFLQHLRELDGLQQGDSSAISHATPR